MRLVCCAEDKDYKAAMHRKRCAPLKDPPPHHYRNTAQSMKGMVPLRSRNKTIMRELRNMRRYARGADGRVDNMPRTY